MNIFLLSIALTTLAQAQEDPAAAGTTPTADASTLDQAADVLGQEDVANLFDEASGMETPLIAGISATGILFILLAWSTCWQWCKLQDAGYAGVCCGLLAWTRCAVKRDQAQPTKGCCRCTNRVPVALFYWLAPVCGLGYYLGLKCYMPEHQQALARVLPQQEFIESSESQEQES